MYQIIDIETGNVIEEVESPPSSLKEGQLLQEVPVNFLENTINMLDSMAREEISTGFTSAEGVIFGLSYTDQLNYAATAALVNMGASQVSIVGEVNDDKYHIVVLSNEEAKVFFGGLFSHVEAILSKYRSVKKSILDSDEEDISQILIDAGIENEEV